MFERCLKWIKCLGWAIGVSLAIVGLAGIPDDIRQWCIWLKWTGDRMDHNTIRLIVLVLGIGAIAMGHFIPSVLRNRRQKKYTGKDRTVGEKSRVREAWRQQIDDLVLHGEETQTWDDRVNWKTKVLDSFDNYLVNPNNFKAEFLKRIKGIDDKGQVTNAAIQRGTAYLKSKRDSLTERELN